MHPHVQPKLMGLLMMLVGVGGSAYGWYSAIVEGVYWPKASMLFPFFACLGLSMFLYPITKAECRERYGTDQLPWRHMPAGQKLLIVLGVALGALQWAVFSGLLPLR